MALCRFIFAAESLGAAIYRLDLSCGLLPPNSREIHNIFPTHLTIK
jgi:hypothetical protein